LKQTFKKAEKIFKTQNPFALFVSQARKDTGIDSKHGNETQKSNSQYQKKVKNFDKFSLNAESLLEAN